MSCRRNWESIYDFGFHLRLRAVQVWIFDLPGAGHRTVRFGVDGIVSGRDRFINALRQFLPPRVGKSGPPAPEPETPVEAWLQFKIRQLEARQQWFLRLLWLVVAGLVVRLFGGDLGDVIKLLALF